MHITAEPPVMNRLLTVLRRLTCSSVFSSLMSLLATPFLWQ
jgi:hypothetical protein